MSDLMTAEELFQLDNGEPCELVKGEFRTMSPAGGRHGKLAIRISYLVTVFVHEKALGEVFAAETGFILARNPDTVRAPDFAFIAKERMHLIKELDEYIAIPPDLAVEVISPNDRWMRIEEKVTDYLQAGVRLVWVVNPSTQTIHVYRSMADVTVLSLADQLDGGDVLPGFAVPVEQIFA